MQRHLPLQAMSLLATLGMAAALGCSDGGAGPGTNVTPPPAPTVAQVIVDVDSTLLTVGSSARATVVATLDARGVPVTGGPPAWSSDNPAILSVNAQGGVTAVSPGVTKVVATVNGVRGDREVVVKPLPAVALLEVSSRGQTFIVGDTATMRALAFDSTGSPLSGRPIAWSVSGDVAVATISASGLLTALAPGEVTVVAQSGDARGELDITVAAPTPTNAIVASVAVTLPSLRLVVGDTVRAQATPLDSLGRVIPPRPVTWSIVGPSTVATISSAGLVTAVSAGAVQVAAMVDGVQGTAALTVADSASGGGGLPIPAPALPETLSFAYPTVTGRQWIVRSGGNLQGALNSAQRGDEIVLEAGARFSGNFTLPAKAGTAANGWILIRSDRSAQLPGQGTRVTPANAPLMALIETPNSNPAIATAAGANGWWLSGLEIAAAQQTTTNYGIVTFGQGTGQNSLAQVPANLVLDRTYVHGAPATQIQRCIALNSARTAVQDSYVFDCHAKGFDSQAILGWNGPGPFKIVNNTLAGAGENIMFGGADPAIPDLTPGDIEIRRNYVYTPATWKGTWTKKNLLELKNAQRVLIEGNVFEGSWRDGQTGDAIVLKVTNQGGRCTWCATRDVIVRHNRIRNVGTLFSIQGLEGGRPYPVGERLNRVHLENNIADNVNVGAYNGAAIMLNVMQNVQNLVIVNNTFTTTGQLGHFLNLANEPAATNVVFERNVVSHGNYGLFNSKYGVGEKSLAAFRGSVTFRDVVIVGTQRAGYPNARFVGTPQAAGGGVGADAARVQSWTGDIVIP